MKKRSKKQGNDNAAIEYPSRTSARRRGKGRRVEKERVKNDVTPKPIDDIKFNRKIMSNLEKSGAINYLIAEMFTQLSIYANQRHHKRLLISSDFKSNIKPQKKYDDDYSDDDTDDVQERNRIKHLIASRIVYEYLIDHQLNLTKYALQNETKNDKAFSSKTPASFSPLQLDDFNANENEEDNNQKSETIKKIIEANKKTELTMKPQKRHNEIEEIVFSAPKSKSNRLKGKNSLNSDFSLPSINSGSMKPVKVSESETESDSDPSLHLKEEKEKEEGIEDDLEEYEEEEDNIEPDQNLDLNDLNDENVEEESNSDSILQHISESNSTAESPPKSRSKKSQKMPATISPKKPKTPSLTPAPPLKTMTPSRASNSTSNDLSLIKTISLSSSNFDLDDNDAANNIRWPRPQSPTHAKNEVDTNDLSINNDNPNLMELQNLDPIAITKSSSQAAEEMQKPLPTDYSHDSLDESSGSEHELQDENEYSSGLENN
ncbi:hypothetical protein M9Y10_042424 [Tritrichomonas musculus]|uniref:LisH domain-containing protein n=1 Tax=Tritrichomonas musculus TaxID=1915356 RepID=A0ABR2GKF2_9EUKA